MATWLHAGLQDGGLTQYGLHKGLSNLGLFSGASLDLRFADTKSLADAVTGQSLVTFTRASSATYVGSDGLIKTAATNEPRFDHNPTTGESLGLLVEELRTNLLLRSEELDNASWSRTGLSSVTANATAAPDGNVTAESLVETTGVSEVHRALQIISVTSGTTYSASAYFKQEGRRHGYIALGPNAAWNSLGASAYIDLQTGTAQSITNCTAVVQALPGSWYRLTITATPTATNASASMILGSSSTGSTQTYAGDGRTAISVWGAQLEAGAFATSYIPTTTATVTRSADVASITGTNFSSWFNATQGTIYAQASTAEATGNPYVVAINDDTSSNRLELRRIGASNVASFIATTLGATEAAPTVAGWTARTSGRLAAAYATNDVNLAFNGTLGPRDTSANLPAVNQMIIGSTTTTIGINQPISRIAYFSQRLPDSTLQALTQ